MNAYMERTIQVRKDVIEITNGDIPIDSSRRKMAEIWGESNRPNPLAALNDWTYPSECGCVPERDGRAGKCSKELAIGG